MSKHRAFNYAIKSNAQSGELATEDWNSFKNKVSNFMSRFERDWTSMFREAKEVKARIVELRQLSKKKKGQIRSDAPHIQLRAYAKWLSKDGRLITKPADLVREIHAALPLVELFGKSWWTTYEQMLKYAEVEVLRGALDNPAETREKMRNTFVNNQPPGFDHVLRHTRTIESPIDGGKTQIQASDLQLGDWFAGAYPVRWGSIAGTFPITARQASPLHMAEMDILDKASIDKLLDDIDGLLDKLGFDEMQSVDKAQSRLYKASLMYGLEDEVEIDEDGSMYGDRQVIALICDIEGYVEHLLEMGSHNDAQSFVLHTCMVIMKWIEQSFKRMD